MKVTGRRASAGLTATLLTLAFAAAGCGSDDDSSDDSASSGGGGDCDEINMGIIPSWTDGLSTSHLLKNQLEEAGFKVNITELSEAAPLYAGLSKGDIDVYPSAWPEVTHASYMEQYGDDIEDLDTYYDNAKLTMAVPDYVDVTSIDQLPDKASEFDGKIIGIEPGAGLTKVTKESVMPTYGLDDDFTLVESSTTAMLAELQKAVDGEEPIVVTLWRPFWANNTFPMRDLEDPEGALGEPEGLHVLATKGFSDDCPDAAAMMSNFKLDDEQYGTLEDTVVNKFESGQEDEAVAAWLKENPDYAATLQQ